MSDAHNDHESAIKTPGQLIAAIAAGFLVPIICIVLLAEYVTSSPKIGAGADAQTAAAIAARIAPVASQDFTLIDANAPKVLQTGEAVYTSTCSACHATGNAGSPKFGDAAAWAPRIAEGYDTLLSHALHGLRVMPAKGGNPNLDDVEVARAVVYMANQAGAKFKEPEVKAAPAAPASPAADTSAPAAAAPTPAAVPATAPAPTAPAALAADAGQKLFAATCTACHTAGVGGAPKFGDKAAWAPRIKQGMATLYEHAIKGFKGQAMMAMPPKGGSSASDDEVRAAVNYMVAAGK